MRLKNGLKWTGFLMIACPMACGLAGGETFTVEQVRLEHPRLLATEETLSRLGDAAEAPEQAAFMELMRRNGEALLAVEPVAHQLIGYRLLTQSRMALKRILMWSMLYRMEGDPRFLDRTILELRTVIGFPDWNPRHYLDVGEMTLAVAIGVDWLWDELPADLRAEALEALYEKGIVPSLDEAHPDNWWLHDNNNWNPVCQAGLVAGALLLAETRPEVTEQVVRRALRLVPNALAATDPDGVYPEGPTYWDYGSAFTAILIDLLQTATGQHFGLADHPSFRESVKFRVMTVGPGGTFYNFYDGPEAVRFTPTVAWFARFYGNPLAHHEASRLLGSFLKAPDWQPDDAHHRLLPLQALWFPETAAEGGPPRPVLPQHWFGDGPNAISVVRENWEDPEAFYLAYKGGRGQISHAHQDAGSFIFEDEGVRWAVDMGAQPYNSLESLGLGIWDRRQDSDRWRVFRIGAASHNLLLIDERPQDVEGQATMTVRHPEPGIIEGVIDLSEVYAGQLERYERTIRAEHFSVLQITDRLSGARSSTGRQGRAPAQLHWRMVTTADITIEGNQAVLRVGDKTLTVRVVEPASFHLRAEPLDTPRYFWDMPNPGYSALDIWTHAENDGHQVITVRLSTDPEAL